MNGESNIYLRRKLPLRRLVLYLISVVGCVVLSFMLIKPHVVPMLVILATSEHVHFHIPFFATEIILKMKEPPIEHLINRLNDPDDYVRRGSTCHVLMRLKHSATGAVPAVARLLRDRDQSIRHCAVITLEEIADERTGYLAARALRECLQEQVPYMRRSVVDALRILGSRSRSVLPSLMDILFNDPDPSVREYAAQALPEIDSESGEVVDALVKALSDKDASVRKMAVSSLKKMSRKARLAIPGLEEKLKADEKTIHDGRVEKPNGP